MAPCSSTSNADINGKLAQLGSRVSVIFAEKFSDDFFNNFAVVLSGVGEAKSGAITIVSNKVYYAGVGLVILGVAAWLLL